MTKILQASEVLDTGYYWTRLSANSAWSIVEVGLRGLNIIEYTPGIADSDELSGEYVGPLPQPD
jgi:hypothetical protein